MKAPRIVIYGRVSTAEQRHDSQLEEVQAYCERRWGGGATVQVITDTASGAKISRAGLEEVMKRVRRGKVDVLACFKLDRLGRSLQHLAQIIAELDQHRVALVIPSQSIDTSSDSPAGRLQMHVLAAVAEFERSLIRERVIAGQAAARAKGTRFGRPASLDGHRERVAELLAQGKSCRVVAKETGLPLGSIFHVSRELRSLAQAATVNGE